MTQGTENGVVVTTETAGAVTITTRKEQKIMQGPGRKVEGKFVKPGQSYMEVTKTYRGPKAQVERLRWKPFGGGKYKTMECEEVYLEYVGCAKKEAPWVANGYYLSQARKDGWNEHEIKLVRKAERPDLKWREIFDRKQKATIASALAKVRAEIKKEKEERAACAGTSGQNAQNEEDEEKPEQEQPVMVKGMSMKDMLKMKAQQRKGGGSGAKGGSISAQLQKKREQRGERKLTIYIQNVPTDWVEDDIADQLADFQIKRISVTRKFNSSGVKVAVGSAFLECYEEDETERCITFLNDRCRWGSMVVSAQHARPKTQRR